MIARYFTGGLALAVAAALGWALWLRGEAIEARAALTAARAALGACEARQTDRDAHQERRDEIDALDDDGLRGRAADWLR